jgi:hypothetical protein
VSETVRPPRVMPVASVEASPPGAELRSVTTRPFQYARGSVSATSSLVLPATGTLG